MEEFIKEKLKVEIKVKKTSAIQLRGDKTIVAAEVESWEQKRDIMKNKKVLERGIFIEDDLTRREREIQQRLREIARGERENGNRNVKVGYKKITIGEKVMIWNEIEGKLTEKKRRI